MSTLHSEAGGGQESKIAWLLLYALFLVYAGFFIFQSSFVIDGQRHFCLFDDAMVSMRYARNLADGQGLVWNPGEGKVEGFTTPLWTVYMAVPHLLGIAPSKASLFIQLSALVCLFLNLVVIRRVARLVGGGDAQVIFGSVLLVAFFYPLNNWSLMGMEVGLLALAISTAILLALQALNTGAPRWWLYVLLAASTLIRMDALVVSAVIIGFLAIAQPGLRRRHLVAGLGSLAAVFAVQTLVRWLYYGDFLPNTYYLKMVGYPALQRIQWGFNIFLMRVSQLNYILCLFPFICLLIRPARQLGLLAAVVLGQVAYSVYVGGDAWEALGPNRYLAAVAPVFFVLFSAASGLTLTWVTDLIKRPGVRRWAFAVLIALSLVRFNVNEGLASLAPVFLQEQSRLAVRNQEMLSLALLLRQVTKEDAKIAVVWAGIIPYFSERPCVDLLGKNDRTIAHQQMHRNPAMGFWPGHLKWDYSESIGRRKPDVVIHLWADQDDAKRFLSGHYVTAGAFGRFFCARDASPKIDWPRVIALHCQGSYLLCAQPL